MSLSVAGIYKRGIAHLEEDHAYMNNPIQELVKALFQMAWTDNVVSPEEVKALTAMLRQLGFSFSDVICLLDKNLCEPPRADTLVPLDSLFQSRDNQMKALQLLMKVCFSTGGIDPKQLGYIEGLVVRMGVTAEELGELRRNALEETC